MDGGTRLAELGVRQGDLLFVQNSADVPCPCGASAARDAEGGVTALPDHLRRVLAEAGPVTCPHYALLLAAHAALLESGLEPAWPVQTSSMPASFPFMRAWTLMSQAWQRTTLASTAKGMFRLWQSLSKLTEHRCNGACLLRTGPSLATAHGC